MATRPGVYTQGSNVLGYLTNLPSVIVVGVEVFGLELELERSSVSALRLRGMRSPMCFLPNFDRPVHDLVGATLQASKTGTQTRWDTIPWSGRAWTVLFVGNQFCPRVDKHDNEFVGRCEDALWPNVKVRYAMIRAIVNKVQRKVLVECVHDEYTL